MANIFQNFPSFNFLYSFKVGFYTRGINIELGIDTRKKNSKREKRITCLEIIKTYKQNITSCFLKNLEKMN